MTASNYQYVENTGLIVPVTSNILAEVQSEWVGAFGNAIELAENTPQGVMISAETTARANVIQNNTAVANQINPNQSEGVFLDVICALTGLPRQGNTFTKVQNVLLTGQPSTPIAARSLAKTTAGDQFALDAAVTLDAVTGQAMSNFTAVQPGPVPCGAGAAGLTAIVTAVLGWETVSNAGTGIAGAAEQSDEALRALRRNTLFLQGVSNIGAISSALWAISGVIGVQILENTQNTGQTISGVEMIAKSVWVCVDGGNSDNIATALLKTKSIGAAWNGSQSLTVIEPASGQPYTVHWDVPSLLPILVQVTVRQGSFVGDPTAAVISAILAYGVNSIAGVDGLALGVNASPFEAGAAVAAQCPGLYVKLVQMALVSGGSLAPAEIPVAIYQKATIAEGNISVILT